MRDCFPKCFLGLLMRNNVCFLLINWLRKGFYLHLYSVLCRLYTSSWRHLSACRLIFTLSVHIFTVPKSHNQTLYIDLSFKASISSSFQFLLSIAFLSELMLCTSLKGQEADWGGTLSPNLFPWDTKNRLR